MIHGVFTVYDSKVGCYLQPFFSPTEGSAIRAFTDCLSDATHPFSRHPEDYTLFDLGAYDDHNAMFITHETPRSIVKASELDIKQIPIERTAFNRNILPKGDI